MFVLQDIDKAHPNLVKTLMTAWSQGFIDDEGGEKIPLAEAIFVLTTEVAQEAIGQIARSEPDSDRLHVACLKILVDAGFPASLLKSIDTAFALKSLTPGEAVLEHYRSFAEQVASHGLVLEEGGIDGRILAHSMDSSIEPISRMPGCRAMSSMPGWRRRKLPAFTRCGWCWARGSSTSSRLASHWRKEEAIPPANADPLSSPEGETAGE